MSGFDDPRYLQQAIEELRRRVGKLEGQTLPFAVHQRGPLPGYMRATAINDPAQKGSMWVNYTNIGPGQGPYQAVTDTTGVIRAEWGSLAANGVSPAQFGFRANDSGGAPIFDSLGLIAVMKLLGSIDTGVSSQSVVGPATRTTASGPNGNASVTFSVSRTQNVLTFYYLSFDSTGNFSYMNAEMDSDNGGGTGGHNHHVAVANSLTFANSLWVRVDSLAAGSHTALVSIDVDNGQTEATNRAQVLVFGLGS